MRILANVPDYDLSIISTEMTVNMYLVLLLLNFAAV